MNPATIFLGLLFVAVIFETTADVSFKVSSLNDKPLYLWIGLILYTIATVLWAFSLRYESLSKAATLYTVLNLILVIMVGIFFFKEDITMINKIGIGVGVLAVILMEM